MNGALSGRHENESDEKLDSYKGTNSEQEYKKKMNWLIIIIVSYLHIGSIYGAYLAFTSAKFATVLFAIALYQLTMWGTTVGVHRLWAHRTYKAKWQLKLLLLIMFTVSYQYSVIHWARDHRVHHKYSDTNADPYNPKRGFIFSHMGWIFITKHPDVISKGKEIDMSDLYSDPLLKFQHEHIGLMSLLFAVAIPTLIPMYFWNETLVNSFYVAVALRWTVTSHIISMVNSVAHMFGNRPYDKNLSAVQSLTSSILTAGEGWHNYHHAFPWDYRASELGKVWTNTSTSIIDFFAWIGWAYDMKTVSDDLISKRVKRTGDGTHPVWGWDDVDMTKEEINGAIILGQK